MSDIRSAGVLGRGQPGRDHNALRGVDVPVMPGATGGELPRPRCEAQTGEQVPARRAGLARRVPAIADREDTSIAVGLVGQHLAEFGPAAAGDRLRQAPVLDHAGHVEVFDGDRAMGGRESGAGLVEKIR